MLRAWQGSGKNQKTTHRALTQIRVIPRSFAYFQSRAGPSPLSLLAFTESFAIRKQQKTTATRLCKKINLLRPKKRPALVEFALKARSDGWGVSPKDAVGRQVQEMNAGVASPGEA